jgi:CRP/FNR family transcriptional regulator
MSTRPPAEPSPLDCLRRHAYFRSLDPHLLSVLAGQAILRSFDPGETILLEGEPSSGLWLIEEGRVKVYKLSPDGREHILHLLGPGDSFNDIAALDGGPNPSSAASLGHTLALNLPSEALNAALHDSPQLAQAVIRALTGRVRSLVQQIEDLALHSATTRLARFLLEQTESPALSGPGITRAAIAAHLATTPETVSRGLRALEQIGAIRFDRHRIVIADEGLLRAIALI